MLAVKVPVSAHKKQCLNSGRAHEQQAPDGGEQQDCRQQQGRQQDGCASQFDHEFCWDIPAEAATSCHASTVAVHFTDPVWLIQELLLDSGNHEKWVLLVRATAAAMN